MSAARFVRLVLVATGLLTAHSVVLSAGAHQHGVARLEVSIDEGGVQVTMESPLEVLVGFERAPKDNAQREALARMVDRLKAGDQLFAIDPAAACTLTASSVEHPFQPGKGGAKGGHADAEATWSWRCEKPAGIKRIEVRLFEVFSRLMTLRVQTATPKGQGSATLVKSRRFISF